MSRGRPREFDPTEALDQALAVFARDGFEQASVQALADGMGICKPSLYAAYGNKESLFIEALRRYALRGNLERDRLLNEEPDGPTALAALLRATAEAASSHGQTGCLLVSEAAAAHAEYPAAVRDAVRDLMESGAVLLRARLVRAIADGHLDESADVEALVRFYGAVMSGLTVQARSGATREQLLAAAEMAMRAWPGAPVG